jgi:hypothetical protein
MENNQQLSSQKPRKISWWKIAVGSLLFFIEIRILVFPDPNIPEALKPSNQTQQQAAFFTSCVICLIGLALIISGIRSAWPRPTK